MRKLVYYIGSSLDGRIAGPGDEVDFYPVGDGEEAASYMGWVNGLYPETVPTRMRGMAGLDGVPNKRFDTVVMGLRTYRMVLDQGVPSPYAHLRQYVVSTSLEESPDPAVRLAREPLALVRELKSEDGPDIWLCGGGGLAASLLPEIDEMIVKSYPVVAGAGVPLFDGAFRPTPFTAADRRTFPNGVAITWYAK
ncbi:dihydrofolate reductase family protein [Actinomadura sp. 21ATH]|uniref:dihydrofolate reductase family protein n=1 Tax=Actinomadura sp. 21ATH TaxID=1735444 RepID=UPI0035BF2564